MIPDFLESGYLPEGIHDATISEVVERFEFSNKRKKLISGLQELIGFCLSLKINIIYLDGSFISGHKLNPNDYDACYDTNHPERERILSEAEPSLLESDSETQKHYFEGEVHYAHTKMTHKEGMPTILEWFQNCKETEGKTKKGIIRLFLANYDNK
ncbi:hypothetical protein D0T85_11660 [Bacteroides sp. 519]|nr:hypothetical protein [Bacteroides sp. 519]